MATPPLILMPRPMSWESGNPETFFFYPRGLWGLLLFFCVRLMRSFAILLSRTSVSSCTLRLPTSFFILISVAGGVTGRLDYRT